MKLKYLFLASLFFFFTGCDSSFDESVTVCPGPTQKVFTFAVDYTTNNFLGGYYIDLPTNFDGFELEAAYNSPGDFGDISLYEKSTKKKLFSGSIVWMGKGEQTFPDKMMPAKSFKRLDHITKMPDITLLSPDGSIDKNPEIDYKPIWKAVESLQSVSWLPYPSEQPQPAYIYLYQPSVGVGDPGDWYWLIFLKY